MQATGLWYTSLSSVFTPLCKISKQIIIVVDNLHVPQFYCLWVHLLKSDNYIALTNILVEQWVFLKFSPPQCLAILKHTTWPVYAIQTNDGLTLVQFKSGCDFVTHEHLLSDNRKEMCIMNLRTFYVRLFLTSFRLVND